MPWAGSFPAQPAHEAKSVSRIWEAPDRQGRPGPRPGSAFLLEPVRDHLLDRGLVGELAGLELGVDQLGVEGHLEAPAAGGDQPQLVDLLLEHREELGRQTDGLGLVVSDRAVLQLDSHVGPPSCPPWATVLYGTREARGADPAGFQSSRHTPCAVLRFCTARERHTECAYYSRWDCAEPCPTLRG